MWHPILFLTISLQTSAYVLQQISSMRTSNSISNIHVLQINGHPKESRLFANVGKEAPEKHGTTHQNSRKFNKTKISHSKTRNDEMKLLGGSDTKPNFFGDDIPKVNSEISFQWVNKDTMKIIWPNQEEEVIHLVISRQFPDSECMFDGSSEKENSIFFFAAIVGCIQSEETIINLTVTNEILEFVLLKNGTTLWNKPQFNEKLYSRQKRSPSGKYKDQILL